VEGWRGGGVRCSRFSVLGSWFVVRCSRFVVRGSLFAVRCSRFAVRGSLLAVRCSRFSVWFVGKRVGVVEWGSRLKAGLQDGGAAEG
jgi:hypothetical protein